MIEKWLYRGWLCIATALLVAALLLLQSSLDAIVPLNHYLWQDGLRWAEMLWLVPVPMALALWIGWFLFAEATRKSPLPLDVPMRNGKPMRLIFRFVTRGDNVEVLRDSAQAVHRAFRIYSRVVGPYRIEMVTERPIDLGQQDDNEAALTSICVVPKAYVSPHRSRFKARALAYVQEQVKAEPEDWYIYLDEESMIDEHVVAGIYHFIARTQQAGKQRKSGGVIGQGAILYQGGHWFFRGADALRTADDLGRFRLQYALGIPLFGVHGSYLVVRGSDDAQLSFDVGPANSITEDTAWALRAWSKGFRFGWVDGYLREQPPQAIMDFVKQRSRWLSGIRLVLLDKQIPFRYRCCLGVFTGLWQLAFLPFLTAFVALFVHVSPFVWMRIPADFAWATYVLAYIQGLDVLTRYKEAQPQSHTFSSLLHMTFQRIASCSLVLCCVWYSFLESMATLYSLKPKQGFFVIQKPSLATVQESRIPEKSTVAVGVEQGRRK